MAVVEVQGVLISVVERAYKPFTDDSGRPVAGGSTYRAFVFTGEGEEPQPIKLRPDQVTDARNAGFGAVVSAQCEVRANGNRVVYQVVDQGLSFKKNGS